MSSPPFAASTSLKCLVVAAEQIAISVLDRLGNFRGVAVLDVNQFCVTDPSRIDCFGNVPQTDEFFDGLQLLTRRTTDDQGAGIGVGKEFQFTRRIQAFRTFVIRVSATKDVAVEPIRIIFLVFFVLLEVVFQIVCNEDNGGIADTKDMIRATWWRNLQHQVLQLIQSIGVVTAEY
ncbi:hypothetical protein-signal peptide and transmembrane prediction [Rhodopirellula baltica SH 1]|uniref:Uncharacterized protein n=1 Tax=Rhodopirellula baltica (strain DSM 10527 / NCIMB 13988 / SH1) TaxID=243090 RepID=Q7ULN2_RHOBA|nr:hypothetical protein-signal peptide and transmembrane prediction [Rhodopirellula baltica SH 1]